MAEFGNFDGGAFTIEDPFDPDHNPGRTLQFESMEHQKFQLATVSILKLILEM
jgi:hypothetical protein